MFRLRVEGKLQARRDVPDERQLHDDHERAAGDGPPRQQFGQPWQCGAVAERHHGRDHRRIPDDRRRVRKKKAAMAVEYAETPRRHHRETDRGKQDPYEVDRQLPCRAGETWRDQIDQQRRGKYPRRHDDADEQREQRGDGAGDAIGGIVIAAGQQRRVDGDEGGRQRSFAKQVVEKVGNPQRGAERVGRRSQPEVVREDPLPHQARQPAAQDADGDQRRRAARSGWSGAARDSIHRQSTSSSTVGTSVPLDFFIK